MRVFKTKPFARFSAREDIADALLCEAVKRAQTGLIDADLGGGVIKQRLPREGQGRSGGYRSLVVFKRDRRAIFVYGFAKNKACDDRASRAEGFSKTSRCHVVT